MYNIVLFIVMLTVMFLFVPFICCIVRTSHYLREWVMNLRILAWLSKSCRGGGEWPNTLIYVCILKISESPIAPHSPVTPHTADIPTNIKIISWNVRELHSPYKRMKIIKHLKRLHTDIALLQDSYMSENDFHGIQILWVGKAIGAP